jgi:hypothetical protein
VREHHQGSQSLKKALHQEFPISCVSNPFAILAGENRELEMMPEGRKHATLFPIRTIAQPKGNKTWKYWPHRFPVEIPQLRMLLRHGAKSQ